MKRVLVVGACHNRLSRALVEALSDMAMKVVTVSDYHNTGVYTLDMCYQTALGERRTEQHKRAWREHARYLQAGIQQRRKDLTKFHQEKRARMAHKQATKRRSRFV